VQLVLPLHACGFQYRPTRSPLRKKRIMMQQVRQYDVIDIWHNTVTKGVRCCRTAALQAAG
jgi:hypothetical protein